MTIKFERPNVSSKVYLERKLPPTFPQRTLKPKWKTYQEVLSDIEEIGVTVDVHNIYPVFVVRTYSGPCVLCRDYTGETAWEAVRTALKATVLILQDLNNKTV